MKCCKIFTLFAAFFLFFIFFPVNNIHAQISGTFNEKFEEIWKLIESKSVLENLPSKKECYEKILEGGLSACLDDPHSRYVPRFNFQMEREDFNGSFAGVGITVMEYYKNIIIVSILPESSADKSGKFHKGDVIVAVDDEYVKDKPLMYVVRKIRGSHGSEVKISVERGGKLMEPVTLVRERIEIPSVKVVDIDEQTTLLKISRFDRHTPILVFEEINSRVGSRLFLHDFTKKNFIIDLRGNPGGLLESVLSITSFFSDNPDDVMTILKGRESEQVITVGNRGDFSSSIYKGIFNDLHFVILVDRWSASASEIFAGIIQDWGKAKIIGVPTFGKGSVQNVFVLKDRDGLHLTIAEYFVGNGRKKVNGVGISPDILVENSPACDEEADIFSERKLADIKHDKQLQRAMEVLKQDK